VWSVLYICFLTGICLPASCHVLIYNVAVETADTSCSTAYFKSSTVQALVLNTEKYPDRENVAWVKFNSRHLANKWSSSMWLRKCGLVKGKDPWITISVRDSWTGQAETKKETVNLFIRTATTLVAFAD
jgi:hypothetical protein